MTLDFQVFFALLQNVNTAKNVLVTNAIVTNCGLVSYMHNSSSQEPFAVFFPVLFLSTQSCPCCFMVKKICFPNLNALALDGFCFLQFCDVAKLAIIHKRNYPNLATGQGGT
jgi:hypothetical protein